MARIHTILLSTALATAIVGCGSSGGDDGGGNGGPQQSAGPAPADFDLAFQGIHYHEDYYGSEVQPQYYSINWSVRNDSDYSPGTVNWTIRRRENGKTLSGTLALGARPEVGDGHNFRYEMATLANGDQSWFEPGTHTLDLTLSHPQEPADNRMNNTHTLIIDIPATSRPEQANDLRFYGREAHVHEAQTDGRLTFHFEAENTGSTPIAGATWRLSSSQVAIPASATAVVIPTIPAGGRVETSTSITITTPGTYVVDMILDPDDAIGTAQDADAGNNVRRFTIVVPGDGAPVAAG